MCTVTDIEIKHINKSLQDLVKGQKENATALNKIEVHVGVSVERWEEQKKLNEQVRKDIEKIDTRNKLFAGVNAIGAILAGIFGVSR